MTVAGTAPIGPAADSKEHWNAPRPQQQLTQQQPQQPGNTITTPGNTLHNTNNTNNTLYNTNNTNNTASTPPLPQHNAPKHKSSNTQKQ